MSLIVLGIVKVSMDKTALWISVGVDDWTSESVIIASNEEVLIVDFCRFFPGNGLLIAG